MPFLAHFSAFFAKKDKICGTLGLFRLGPEKWLKLVIFPDGGNFQIWGKFSGLIRGKNPLGDLVL